MMKSAGRVAVGAMVTSLLAACGGLGSGSDALVDVPKVCALSVEQAQGSDYVDTGLVRSDVTDGQTGVPLTLTITVVDNVLCLPIADAAIDVWSADALGVYSDEAAAGTSDQTFLRGVQLTDSGGQATFATVYPGWFDANAPDVHVKVHIGGTVSGTTYTSSGGHVAHTGQLFFPQDQDDQVKLVAPYTTNTNTYVTNASDTVYTTQSGDTSELVLLGTPTSGYTAKITLVVDPTATPATL